MTRRRERRYRRWRNREIRKWVRRWNADEDTTVGYRGRVTATDARDAWPYDPREFEPALARAAMAGRDVCPGARGLGRCWGVS